jgi:hypothetical protein
VGKESANFLRFDPSARWNRRDLDCALSSHNPKVVGSNLTPATNPRFTGRAQASGLLVFPRSARGYGPRVGLSFLLSDSAVGLGRRSSVQILPLPAVCPRSESNEKCRPEIERPREMATRCTMPRVWDIKRKSRFRQTEKTGWESAGLVRLRGSLTAPAIRSWLGRSSKAEISRSNGAISLPCHTHKFSSKKLRGMRMR